MMKVFPLIVGAAVAVATQSNAVAAGLTAIHAIPGYRCMAVNLTGAELENPNVTVRLKKEPSSSAADDGLAPATVFVADPPDLSSGYLRALKLDNTTAWVKSTDVKVWHSPDGDPNTTCTPSMMSNGRVGFSIH